MIPQPSQSHVPPHDLDAEASVLGALLLDVGAVARVADQLSPADFYRENNGQIFRAATTLFRKGDPIDNITLAAELEKMGLLERVGGRAQLAQLQEQTPTAGNIEHYARIVKDRALKRRLIDAGGKLTAAGRDEALDAGEALSVAEREWSTVRQAAAALIRREPEPRGELVPMTPFPFAALPPQLHQLAIAAHRAFGYPAEFVAVPGLSALAVAVGGACVLQAMAGWISRPILWTIVIAPPGSAKSPAQRLALAPLVALESEWADRYQDEATEHEAVLAGAPPRKGQPPPPGPVRLRCRASDANIAALSKVLIENPDRGIAWEANEVSSIIGALSQSSGGDRGSDRPRFLQLWDGADWPLDRIIRGTALIRRPLVSVVGGLQPDRLAVLAGGDGLGARFLRCYYPNAGMAVANPRDALHQTVLDAWEALIRDLVDHQPDAMRPPRILTLRPDARELWIAVQHELRGLYDADSTSTFGQEVIAKGTEQLLRLALVLHCAAYPGEPPQLVLPESVAAAADLVRYFVHQALACEPDEPSAAADRQTRDLDAGVAKLIRWIQRRAEPWATARDIKRATIAGLKTAAEVDRVLDRYAEIHPGAVVEGRAPGASRGRVGRLVYLPGQVPSVDATRRGAGDRSGGPGIVGNVGIVGGDTGENDTSERPRRLVSTQESSSDLSSDPSEIPSVPTYPPDKTDSTDKFPTGAPDTLGNDANASNRGIPEAID